MQDEIRSILKQLGEDPDREGLLDTPKRVDKAFRFLTAGYGQTPEDVVRGAIFHEKYDEMVLVRDIDFYSLCEHHMLPFYGKAHVAYVPNGRIIGLSKIPRLVEVFSRRLQVQERLTVQIAESLQEYLEPLGVAVVIEAAHLCMMMRGVQKQNTKMVTSSVLGCFRDEDSARNEFLNLLKGVS
jgi:GTP cyclohydrolase I